MSPCKCEEPLPQKMFGVEVCVRCDGMISDDKEVTAAAVNMGRIMGAFD